MSPLFELTKIIPRTRDSVRGVCGSGLGNFKQCRQNKTTYLAPDFQLSVVLRVYGSFYIEIPADPGNYLPSRSRVGVISRTAYKSLHFIRGWGGGGK